MRENDYIYLHKFGKHKYMKALREGVISFAALGSYIEQARNTKNIDQGDEHEGVFARLKQGDPRIQDAANYLGDDLEYIPDGDYVLLRRPSSYLIPTFCIYGITEGDITASVQSSGWQDVRINYDSRLYSGFTEPATNEDDMPSQFIVKSDVFRNVVYHALNRNEEDYVIRKVNYSLFEKEEYYLDPVGDKREELYHKRPYYKYQKELRICLPRVKLVSITERYPLKSDVFTPSELAPNIQLFAVLRVNIEQLPD